MKSERNYPWGQNKKIENIGLEAIPERLKENDYQILLIAGPNAVGKGTIVENILKSNKGFVQVLRATTKPIEDTKEENITYAFLTEEIFFNMIDQQELIEWGKYGQGYYGTPLKSIVESLAYGNKLVIDTDLDGGVILREFFKKLGVDVYDCFISPIPKQWLDSENGKEKALEALRWRLLSRGRGEAQEEIEGRIRNARNMITRANEFGYFIANEYGKVGQSVTEILSLFKDN